MFTKLWVFSCFCGVFVSTLTFLAFSFVFLENFPVTNLIYLILANPCASTNDLQTEIMLFR